MLENDLEVWEYDAFLEELSNRCPAKDLLRVTNYVVRRMMTTKIDNKLGYFMIAVKDGLKQIYRPEFNKDNFENVAKEIAVKAKEEGRI